MNRPLLKFFLGCASALTFSSFSYKAHAADPRFGAMTHFAQGWDPVWADIASMRYVNNVRDELYWNVVETQPGVYTFPATYDNYMASLKADQIDPLIILDFENGLYDGGMTPYSDQACTAFANYGNAVLQHYGSQIQSVEIWNEFNGSFCTGPDTISRPAAYLKILNSAYAAIKAARPDVTVAGGATAGVPLPYWQALMAGGGLASMDVLSVHPYRYNSPPEGIESDIAALQALTQQYNNGQTKPIWVTEIGWQIQDGSVPGQLPIDEPTQAKFLVRAYALLLSANVERIYWYDLHDDQGISTLGLMTPDATPRLSAYAYQILTTELSGAAFVKREQSNTGLYSILFQRIDGTQVRVLWSLTPTSFNSTGATKAVDMVGNYVAPTGQLTLTDSPIFVEGPMQGLPAPIIETPITDSSTGFSGTQGTNGWSFGDFVGTGAFELMTNYSVTDWNAEWGSMYPYLSMTPGDQHPSVWGTQQVSAVRRWTSTVAGTVHVVGNFQSGTGGDGVGVSVLVNGQPTVARQLIGGTSGLTQQTFDFVVTVSVGSTVDFVVDPGPALDINFDATTMTAAMSSRSGG